MKMISTYNIGHRIITAPDGIREKENNMEENTNPCTNHACLDSGLACPECSIVDIDKLDGESFAQAMWGIKIYNCTPHEVALLLPDRVVRFVPATVPIRLAQKVVHLSTPFSLTEFGEPIGLPKQQPGIFLIVSQLVKNICVDRTDLIVPTEIVRDEKGNIIGCKSFGK